MKTVTKRFFFFFILTLGTLLCDLCLFFIAEKQISAFTLALFIFQLFPFPSGTRIMCAGSAVCLQSLILFSTPYTPLIYLLPSITAARYANDRLYQNPLLPVGMLTCCLTAQIWLLQPHLLNSTGNTTCTFLANFATIISAVMISLTLRKQGGRGSRPRP